MLEYIPTVVQVIPYEDYTVDVYFDDGKIVCCHAEKDLALHNVSKCGLYI